MSEVFQIGKREIGQGRPVYVVAELSANHNQSFERAVEIVHAAKKAGADAIKLQTYTPDTMTVRSDRDIFRIKGGTLWDGRTLHDLYADASTPWEWHPKLQKVAADAGLDFFSSPFDSSAVDFLESLNLPAYKIASPEIVDLPLIEKAARTGKPLIISTGMASRDEIQEALDTARRAGANEIALLKCTSAYPAPAEEMNLRTIPELARIFGVPAGLSDHTVGIAAPVAAVALGACIVEKHFTLSRADPSPDSAFSLEPQEFRAMVDAIRVAEKALGSVQISPSPREEAIRTLRRSLFVVESMKQGEIFTSQNLRSIRPANGLHTRHLQQIIGQRCTRDVERGTPLAWDLVQKP
jgi:N-acetylneuraminate synthase